MSMLKNKITIVTGGSSGNGRSIAAKFIEQGAKVIVADLHPEAREGGIPTADMINKNHSDTAKLVECDVSNLADLEAVVAEAEA